MKREHYWMLANALKAVPNEITKTVLVMKLCQLMKADNPKFDTELFMDAAGV
jgi:hypothetical protein